MTLEEKKHSYLQRVIKGVVIFGILGALVLFFAITHISNVFKQVLSGASSTAGTSAKE